MDSSLLATKLRIPSQARPAVYRQRLIDALESSIARYKLIHVSAPAGYGKTTLLSQWAHSTSYDIAWLSIDEEDNDVEQFLRYLLAAWGKIHPRITETSFGLLLSGMSPELQAVLSAFLNVANDLPEPLVFVLDDYHLIKDPTIDQALTFLFDHLPPRLHFVLAGRDEPALPLARYRAHDELLEFRGENLQFSLDETADFLGHMMRLSLSQDEIMTLQAQSEGWIAGLQLAALTLQQHKSGTDPVHISGRQRFIADYLSQEVLRRLPLTASSFLVQTSILDRLSGPLCDAVTGSQDAQDLLDNIERENLFLLPLDDNRQWFRYHRLFADFLRGELVRRHPRDVPVLHHRAAEWYVARDMPEQAFPHAVESGDVEFVIQILDRYSSIKLLGGEIRVIQTWLESLPEEWQSTHPMIAFTRASMLIFTGQFDEGVRLLDQVEQLMLLRKKDLHGVRAKVTAVRCFIACYQNDLVQAEELAQQALESLPQDALDLRHGIYGSLGDTYRRNGRWEESKVCYLKSLESPYGLAHRIGSVHAFGALADLELRQGRLHSAAAYWRKAHAAIQEREASGSFPLPLIGWVYIRLGEILYEWNQLGEASEHLSRGLKRAELGGEVQALISGNLATCRLQLTEGNIHAAEEHLEQARALVESSSFPDWTSRYWRLQLELWLAQDRLRALVDWADGMRRHALTGRPEGEIAEVAVARVLILKGDTLSLEKASASLGSLLKVAESEGRMGVLIEVLALESLTHWRRGERAGAMIALERALRLAEPEGYIRLFADLGLPMARVLQEAYARQVMPNYIERLLVAFRDLGSLASPTKQSFPQALSPRELQVLQMIAGGLTNREIAEQLVISSETVKKHTGTIYSKLGVSSRTQAAARARELHLLD